MIKDYDNFFLTVDNLDKAREFYQNTLGLNVKFNFPERGITGYKVANQEPAIILKDKNKHPHAKPTIWFVVDDVHESYNKLKNMGVTFLSKPFRINVGTAVEFEDPFGNRLGLTSYNDYYFHK